MNLRTIQLMFEICSFETTGLTTWRDKFVIVVVKVNFIVL